MCGGVYYSINGQDTRVYFPNPKALAYMIGKLYVHHEDIL